MMLVDVKSAFQMRGDRQSGLSGPLGYGFAFDRAVAPEDDKFVAIGGISIERSK